MRMLLQHPHLGAIQGQEKGQTSQFLGIQYASLAHGFAVAELKETYHDGKIDATKSGYLNISIAYIIPHGLK